MPAYAEKPETTARKLARLAQLQMEISLHLTAIRGKNEGRGEDKLHRRHHDALRKGQERQNSLRSIRLELASEFDKKSEVWALLSENWHSQFGRDVLPEEGK